jgi:hypothetical protein
MPQSNKRTASLPSPSPAGLQSHCSTLQGSPPLVWLHQAPAPCWIHAPPGSLLPGPCQIHTPPGSPPLGAGHQLSVRQPYLPACWDPHHLGGAGPSSTGFPYNCSTRLPFRPPLEVSKSA